MAVLDGIFIFWVFTSLSKTLAQLQTRRAGAKLELYRYTALHTGALVLCRPATLCERHSKRLPLNEPGNNVSTDLAFNVHQEVHEHAGADGMGERGMDSVRDVL